MLTQSSLKKGRGEGEGMRGDPSQGRKHSESPIPTALGHSQGSAALTLTDILLVPQADLGAFPV